MKNLSILTSLLLWLADSVRSSELCQQCTCQCNFQYTLEGESETCSANCANLDFVTFPSTLVKMDTVQPTYKMLNLQANQIEILKNPEIKELKVEQLFLSGNQISDIEIGFFDFVAPTLRQLFLTNNRLTRLRKGQFRGLAKLQILRLNSNQIYDIEPGTFEDLTSLSFLYLDDNHLQTLFANTFVGLSELNNLLLSDNNINCFEPKALDGLDKMLYLDLEQNSLQTISGSIGSNLPALNSLWLGENNISRIDISLFKSAPQIHILGLSSNALDTIDQCVFNHLPNNPWLNNLWLKDNSFHCDCRMHWVRSNSQLVRAFDDVPACSTPAKLVNYSILSYPQKQCEGEKSKCSNDEPEFDTCAQPIPGKRRDPRFDDATETNTVIEYKTPTWAIVTIVVLLILCLILLCVLLFYIGKFRQKDPIRVTVTTTPPSSDVKPITV